MSGPREEPASGVVVAGGAMGTIVTGGSRVGEETARLFSADGYRDHLAPHSPSVPLAVARAEYRIGVALSEEFNAGGRS